MPIDTIFFKPLNKSMVIVHYIDDSPTRRVGELATPWLAESWSRRLYDPPSFSFKHSKDDSPTSQVGESATPRLAESESQGFPDSPSWGGVFRLRISPRIRSQKRNGSKVSVRDLWGPNFCKNPRKSASLPCPFKNMSKLEIFSRWRSLR